MLFLRCDCSHVALFICLLPFPYSLRRNIRARHCNMFRRGTRVSERQGACRKGEYRDERGGRHTPVQEVEGARLRDEYLQRMVGFFVFFFAFSFPRIFSFPFASHTAHVRPISLLESLYAPSLSFFTCISLSLCFSSFSTCLSLPLSLSFSVLEISHYL